MSETRDVTVPDIGDFHDVPVIEILVKPGDTIAVNDPLVTLESDKASMEIPSSAAGTVAEVKIKVGDRVSKGTPIVTLAALRQAQGDTNATTSTNANGNANADPNANASTSASTNASTSANANGSASGAQRASQETGDTGVTLSASKGAGTVELTVPDIGDFHDIPVIDVLVKAGDVVEKEAPLVTLESDKASMDVPAAQAGTIVEVRVKAGDRVSKGTVIATLASSSQPSAAPSQQAQSQQQQTQPQPAQAQRAQAAQPQAAAPPVADGKGVHASPAVRKLARELGLDLSGVRGTGPHGRITRDDLHGHVKNALARGASSPSGGTSSFAGLPPWPNVDFAKFGEIERKELPRIKRLSGPNLHRNWLSIPHITNYDEADITDLEAFRIQSNGERKDGAKLTMLAFLVKAVVAALQRYPEFNASLDGDALVYKRYYNIGFAADTPNGLVVPVIKGADRKGLLEIARDAAELAAKARDGKLGMGDMTGGSFTISSIGGIGGTQFTQIVNAPEVAILGATRSTMKPVWDGTSFVPRLILPVSVSYDHRVIDGALAARFLAHLTGLLGDFRRVLL